MLSAGGKTRHLIADVEGVMFPVQKGTPIQMEETISAEDKSNGIIFS